MSQDSEFAAILDGLDSDTLNNMLDEGPGIVNSGARIHPSYADVPATLPPYYQQSTHMEGCLMPPTVTPSLANHSLTSAYNSTIPLSVLATSPSHVSAIGSTSYSPDQSNQRIQHTPPLYCPEHSKPAASPPTPPPNFTSVVSRQTSDGVFLGDLQFELNIPVQTKLTKSTPFVYSKPLNKLFIQREVQCPITFKISTFQPGLSVRASPFYTHHHHRSCPVTACHVHSEPSPIGSHSFSSWIKTAGGSSQVVKSNQDLTVMSPWSIEETSMQVTYMFACRNTCVGGPNRRSTTVAFCLESHPGQVIGKQVVEVKVVASPGRDKEKEEKKFLSEQNKQTPNSPSRLVPSKKSQSPQTFKKPKTPPEEEVVPHTGKRLPFVDDRPAKYYIGVNDRRTYEVLAPIRDSLDLMNSLKGEEKETDTNKDDVRPPLTSKCSNSSRSCSRSLLDVNSPDSSQQENSISAWLKSFGFQCYADAFAQAGLHSMDQITHFTMKHINDLRLITHHGRIILKNLAKYREELPLSQPMSSGEPIGLIAFSKDMIKQEVVSSSSSED